MQKFSFSENKADSILEIDLAALRDNYKTLRNLVSPAECAAVLKADAYGLGMAEVAPVLVASGCKTYFVANLCEGIRLRQVLGNIPNIFIFNCHSHPNHFACLLLLLVFSN